MTVEVRIKPGYGSHTTWEDGVANRYKVGDVFAVTEQEFKDFRYKFEKVKETVSPPASVEKVTIQPAAPPPSEPSEEEPFDLDVPNARVSDVLAAVRGGQLAAQDALAAEQTRDKPRESLIRSLTARIEGEADDD